MLCCTDHLDIVRDTISSGDYKSEEDPELFKSKQTGRGPLEMDWLQKYSKAARDPGSNMAIMCAYKLCKVEFRYWGMQSKIERFIHDVGESSADFMSGFLCKQAIILSKVSRVKAVTTLQHVSWYQKGNVF